MATNLPPGQTPGYGQVAGAREADSFSGVRAHGLDPTLEPGNYAPSLFGVPLPQNTGAPGTAGAQPGTGDPTNQPGQVYEGISGEGPSDIANTGSPGSQGAQNQGASGEPINYTRPGSFLSGTYVQDTVTDSVSGPMDWTQANDQGYGSGGPQLPGIKGNEPTSTGSGHGSVMRGGRAVGG